MRPARKQTQCGVTLIEMIIVIVVSGILLSIVSMFVRNQVEAYVDVSRRAELSDIADGVMRRIARDVQGSLPNSLRPALSSTYIELVPVANAGRFASLDSSVIASPLTLQGPPISVTADQQLVICNTGQPSANVYVGINRRALAAAADTNSLIFTGADLTDYCSSNRYQIVTNSVAYAFETPNLWRYSGCTIKDLQSATIADLSANCTTKSMMASNVLGVSFNYSPNALPSLGILTVELVLASTKAPTERVTLLQQINVLNSP